LDPVLLVGLIVRENKGLAVANKLLVNSENYISLKDWDQSRWQAAVEVVERIVFPDEDISQRIDVAYANGMTLGLAQAYLHFDDHALESRIVEAFPFLKPKAKRAGDLMAHIVETVLSEISDLLPMDLLHTFQELLDAPRSN
jgi:hypothetical protein